MLEGFDRVREAQAIPVEARRRKLMAIPELEIHRHLESLFTSIESNVRVEITHGNDEHGRDLVIERHDPYGVQYVGVVVKRAPAGGQITARTAGPVDEIISQIKQCVSHPCQLRTLTTSSVSISSVWVVFLGNLTNGALSRLDKESPIGVKPRLFTIGEMVSLFTAHYPEVFFQGQASNYLVNRIMQLETASSFRVKAANLSAWYVEPMVAASIESGASFEEEMALALRTARLPFSRLRDYVRPGSRFVLIGDPGSGKSTALAKIAVDILVDALNELTHESPRTGKSPRHSVHVPLLMKATGIRDVAHLDVELERHLPPPEIRDRFQVSSIMVDGLDELRSEERGPFLAALVAVTAQKGWGLVVSSRRVAAANAESIRQLSVPVNRFELLPFEYRDAMRMVDKLVDDQTALAILREGIARVAGQIVLTPLAIELLIDVAIAEHEIPGSMAEIFDRFVDIALGRYDRARGIESVFEYYIKKRFLSELAWTEFFNKDRDNIPDRDFAAFTQRHLTTYGFDSMRFGQLVNEIERSGLLSLGEPVYFAHRSFLEHFVARRMFDHGQESNTVEDDVANIYFDGYWSDVAFHFVGLKREISETFLANISAHEPSDLGDFLLLMALGRVLQAGWHSPTARKERGILIGLSASEAVYESIHKMQQESKGRIPSIAPLISLIAFGEYAYGSETLRQENLRLIGQFADSPSVPNLRKALALLWAIRSRLSDSERNDCFEHVLDALVKLASTGVISLEDEAASLLILSQVVNEDPVLTKALNRRLRRLWKRFPDEMKRVLPGPRRGFRKGSARTGRLSTRVTRTVEPR